jgi:hypothetical protein
MNLTAEFNAAFRSRLRESPVARYQLASLKTRIANAAGETDLDPTDEQKKAGNYRKGRFWMWGREFVIENPRGSTRKGTAPNGKQWSVTMPQHYGYIRRTLSEADNDHLDVFVGPHHRSQLVFVVDQQTPGGKFDEHKALVGFQHINQARQAYRDAYNHGWQGLRDITPMTVPQFLAWVDKGDTGKPVAGQVSKYGKEYDPSQPRDEEGRWANGNAIKSFDAIVSTLWSLHQVNGSSQAKAVAKKFINQPLHNEDSGIAATVSIASLGKLLHQSSWRKSDNNIAHLWAVANLDKLFPVALHRESREDRESNSAINAIHHFEVPMPFGGDVWRVKILAKEFVQKDQGTRLYDLSVVEVMKPASKGGSQSDRDQVRSPHPPAGFDDRFARFVEAVKNAMPARNAYSRLAAEFNRAFRESAVERYAAGQQRGLFDESKHPRETRETAAGDKRPGEFAAKNTQHPVAAAIDEAFSLKRVSATKFAPKDQAGQQSDLFGEAKLTHSPADEFVKPQVESLPGQKSLLNEAKSTGHIGFQGDFEYFKNDRGELNRAKRNEAVMPDGRRTGRWEAPAHQADQRVKMLGIEGASPAKTDETPSKKLSMREKKKAQEWSTIFRITPKQATDALSRGIELVGAKPRAAGSETHLIARKDGREIVGTIDELLGSRKDASPPPSTTPTTYRWLAREIFKAMGGGNWNEQPLQHWTDKARRIAAAPKTAEGIHAAIVNEPWMAKQKPSKIDELQYGKIIEAMRGRHFVDELPVARHALSAVFNACLVERYGQLGFKFHEEDHPRGQPENAGEFRKKDSPAPTVTTATASTPVATKWIAKGSGVFDAATGQRHGQFRDDATAGKFAAMWNERDRLKAIEPVAEKPPKPASAAASSPPKVAEQSIPKEHPVTTAINKRMMEDFGEKIGGARKDTARPLGSRGKKTATADESRPAWARRYEIGQIEKSRNKAEEGQWVIRDTKDTDGWGQPRQKGGLFTSKEEAEAALPLIAVSRNHRVRVISGSLPENNREFGIVRNITDRKVAVVKGGFPTEEDARRYMATHPAEIIEHKFPRYEDYAYLDHVERKGPERKRGSASPDDFQKAFQFRGGEFGNWNSGKDGQTSLDHAYDALHDLSDALGLPAKAIALNGDLAIAFGARGTGGKDAARAHYESDARVINLTKMAGAGSLAHEWGHGLDWHLGNGIPAISSVPRENPLRPELVTASQNLRDAMFTKTTIKARDEAQESKKLDHAAEDVRSKIDRIEKNHQMLVSYPHKKLAKPFTDDQQKQWDTLKAKLLAGDVGERTYVGTSGRGMGYPTFEPIAEMNKLYKSATGRSFHTAQEHSEGNNLYWAVQRLKSANERVGSVSSGATDTLRGKSNFANEAIKLDSTRTSDYYSEPHEMFARAFEAYVADKLAEKGIRSDYLVSRGKTDNANYAIIDAKPFPEGEERTKINAAFDAFFAALKNEPRRDDKGEHVRLYSLSQQFQREFVERYDLAPHVFKSIAQQIHGTKPIKPLGGRLHGLPGWPTPSGGNSGGGGIQFDPTKHPRSVAGSPTGGQFTSKVGGGASPSSTTGGFNVSPEVLERARQNVSRQTIGEPNRRWAPLPPKSERLSPMPELPDQLKPKVAPKHQHQHSLKPKPLGKREQSLHDVARAAAEHYDVPVEHVLSMIDEVHKTHREHAERREAFKAEARRRLGVNSRILERTKEDTAAVRGIDTAAREMGGSRDTSDFYGGLGEWNDILTGDPDTFPQQIHELVREGKRRLPLRHDPEIVDEAARRVFDSMPAHHRLRMSLNHAMSGAASPALSSPVDREPGDESDSSFDFGANPGAATAVDEARLNEPFSLRHRLDHEFYRRMISA